MNETIPEVGVVWHSCDDPNDRPGRGDRVLIWHRCRPWCRFFKLQMGWWNGAGWYRDDSNWQHAKIYQPAKWRFVTGPEGREW